MDQESFEKSEQAFYQYEARKVIDELREQGYEYVLIDHPKNQIYFRAYGSDDEKAMMEPDIMMLLADIMKNKSIKADTLLTQNEAVIAKKKPIYIDAK